MNWSDQSHQTSFFLQMMEKRIKKNDILCVIDKKIDFAFINELCRPLYSELGAIGYCPERLFRMLLVMYLDNIRSERQLTERLQDSIRYMWFCKIDLDQCPPNHSTFSVLRSRLGDETFKAIFQNILSQMLQQEIIKPKSISVDSTSVLADVKLPHKEDKESKGPIISKNDSDARYGHTSPKKGFFGYKAQMMVDNDTGVIINTDVQPGNMDDKSLDLSFITEPMDQHNLKIQEAALDRGFDCYSIRRILQENNIKAAIPLKQTAHSDVFGLEKFNINLGRKEAFCPAEHPMKYNGLWSRNRVYDFSGTLCKDCSLKNQCTTSKIRRITVHEDYPLKASAYLFNQTEQYRHLSNKRSCVERVNGEAKCYHGLRRAKFRCRWKLRIQVFLTAIAINLKRVAKFYLLAPYVNLSGP